MKKRKAKIIVGAAGGTAHKGSKTYKVSLPSAWINELGLNEDNRDVELVFDGEKILVQLVKTIDSFKKEKFNLHRALRQNMMVTVED